MISLILICTKLFVSYQLQIKMGIRLPSQLFHGVGKCGFNYCRSDNSIHSSPI